MKIYLASSWRNTLQPAILEMLRVAGHDVYDFRNPAPGNTGFSWSSIDPNWLNWTPEQYRKALRHPIALDGYRTDLAAIRNSEACVLLLPSGRSASWEFGYATAMGKRTIVAMFDGHGQNGSNITYQAACACEPELMYCASPIATSCEELLGWADAHKKN